MFPVFEVFGRQIGVYGICAAVGFLLSGFVGARLAKRFGISFEDFILIMLAAIGGLFIGAHLFFGLSNLKVIIAIFSRLEILGWGKALSLLAECFSGMVFYGGFIGGAVGIVIYTRFAKSIRRGNMLDVYAVLIPLFHTFGRIGCFFAGCCYGVESTFGFTVHGNEINPTVNDVNRLPVQLIEAGCNLIIFLVILKLFQKMILSDRLIYIYMLIYPPVRFTLEFFRGDAYRGIFFGLSTSQWISIFLFAFSIVMLICGAAKRKKQAALTP